MKNEVKRDRFGQYDGEWTEREFALLALLEEVASPDINVGKTLAAYMADIIELLT